MYGSVARLLGIERGLLFNKPFVSFIAGPEDKNIYFKHREESSQSSGKHTCEIRLKRNDGTLFYAQLQSIATEEIGAKVRNAAEKDLVAKHVSDIHGVKSVKNKMTIE